MKRIMALVLAAFVLPLCLSAQSLTRNDDENKETKIIFTMMNGKPAEIYSVNSMSWGVSTAVTVGRGGYVGSTAGTSSGVNSTFVCRTPAELTLDKGQVQLQIGQGLTSRIFYINATGGEQEWSVRPGNDGMQVGGILLGSLGLSATICGVIFGVCGLGNGFYGMAGGGAALAAVGFTMVGFSKAKAKLVRTSY